MNAWYRSWVVPALVCALGTGGALLGETTGLDREVPLVDPGPPPAPAYSAEARTLLGGLAPGDEIEGGWHVVGISGPTEDRILIELELEGARITIHVLVRTEGERPAPLARGPYDLYFVVPPEQQPPPGAIDSALGGIAVRIVDDAPVPDGM